MTWKIGQGRGKTCSKECRHKFQKIVMSGEKSIWWKGGRFFSEAGYIYIYSPNHPFKKRNGYVSEHRLIMENYIGRFLTQKEIVHHINENRSDNRIENLKLMMNNSEHRKEHTKNISCICGEKVEARGLCKVHYHRWYATGIIDFSPRKRDNRFQHHKPTDL